MCCHDLGIESVVSKVSLVPSSRDLHFSVSMRITRATDRGTVQGLQKRKCPVPWPQVRRARLLCNGKGSSELRWGVEKELAHQMAVT